MSAAGGRWIVPVCLLLDLLLLVGTWTGVTTRPMHADAALGVAPMPPPVHVDACRARFAVDAEYCQLSSTTDPLTAVIVGDSHAAHWFPALRAYGTAHHVGIALLGQSGCPPLVDLERAHVSGRDRCLDVNRAVLAAVTRETDVRTVWLSFRGTTAVSGRGYGAVESTITTTFHDVTSPALSQRDAIAATLMRTVRRLVDARKAVSIVLPVPELGFALEECLGRPVSVSHSVPRQPCRVPRADVLARQADYRAIVEGVRRAVGALQIIDPLNGLCDAAQCWAIRDGVVLYGDSNHLSVSGSVAISAALAWPGEQR